PGVCSSYWSTAWLPSIPRPVHQIPPPHKEDTVMEQTNSNWIPVTFVAWFTRQRLAQVLLPAVPAAGDEVYIAGRGYDVVLNEWWLTAGSSVEVVVLLQLQIDESGERPVFRPEDMVMTEKEDERSEPDA